MTFLTLIPPAFYDVRQYEAKVDGTTNDSSKIADTIAACDASGGGYVFLPGTCAISTPVNLNTTNAVVLMSSGGGGLRPLPSFSGSQIVNITSDFCGVRDLLIAYTNTTYSTNPAANGIQITGARSVTLSNVYLNFINGWALQSSATASIANYWAQLINVHGYQCAKGIHILGATGSNFDMAHTLTNCIMDQIKNGDAFFVEDAHDVLFVNTEGNVTAGSGNSFHIKGASAAIYSMGSDMGPAPGPASAGTLLIEAGSNGTPKQITFTGGIIEGGTPGVSITAGTQITLQGIDIENNGTYGVSITGGDGITIAGCKFVQNGSTAGSGHYDLTTSTSGHVIINNCHFMTTQGIGSQQVANVINATAGTVSVHDCMFSGTGFTASTIFNGLPSRIKNNSGYNPLGISSITVGSSPFTYTAGSTSETVYIRGGTISGIVKGGLTVFTASGATVDLEPGESITVTWSVLPTMIKDQH